MKIHILAQVKDGPWGGTSQFLKALRKEWQRQGVYENVPEKAGALLFNSYPSKAEFLFDRLYQLKKNYPEKIIIYRVDGPISGYRGTGTEIDEIIALCSHIFADGIIFQSQWSCEENKKKFTIGAPHETVIYNAPDNTIFNRNHKKPLLPLKKMRLISSGWSTNPQKGFQTLEWLDKNLDFSQYDFTFVGNSPIQFKNIKMHPPVSSPELAILLKEHDVYIFTSKIEACSNALIEALSCGLPAIAPYSTSNPEVVQGGGELFHGTEDILDTLKRVTENYSHYYALLPQFSLETVAHDYLAFAENIYQESHNGTYQPKMITAERKKLYSSLKVLVWKNKIKNVLRILSKNFLHLFYAK